MKNKTILLFFFHVTLVTAASVYDIAKEDTKLVSTPTLSFAVSLWCHLVISHVCKMYKLRLLFCSSRWNFVSLRQNTWRLNIVPHSYWLLRCPCHLRYSQVHGTHSLTRIGWFGSHVPVADYLHTRVKTHSYWLFGSRVSLSLSRGTYLPANRIGAGGSGEGDEISFGSRLRQVVRHTMRRFWPRLFHIFPGFRYSRINCSRDWQPDSASVLRFIRKPIEWKHSLVHR